MYALIFSLLFLANYANCQTTPYTSCTKGRATSYSGGSSGACNFGGITGVNFGVPLTTGIAIQQANWFNASACGECYEVGGPGTSGVVQMIVQDMCPAQGNMQWCSGLDGIVHFDLETNAFAALAPISVGAIYTNYKKIPCPIPTGTNIGLYLVTGSSDYYVGITAFNHRFGIVQMEFAENGNAFVTLTRNSNNFIEYSNSAGIALPAQVRLTATTGEQVIIPITSISSGATITSSVQFSLNPNYTSTIQCIYVTDSWIYVNGLNSGLPGKTVAQDWRSSNWGVVGSVNFTSTVSPHSGSYDIQVMFNNYGGLQLFRGITVPFTQVSGITFWIRADSMLANGVSFNIQNAASQLASSITISLTTNWTMYTYDFATYAPTFQDVLLLVWQSKISTNTPNIYIDDVNFIMVGNITTTTTTTGGPMTTTNGPLTTTQTPSNNTKNNAFVNGIAHSVLIVALLCML